MIILFQNKSGFTLELRLEGIYYLNTQYINPTNIEIELTEYEHI